AVRVYGAAGEQDPHSFIVTQVVGGVKVIDNFYPNERNINFPDDPYYQDPSDKKLVPVTEHYLSILPLQFQNPTEVFVFHFNPAVALNTTVRSVGDEIRSYVHASGAAAALSAPADGAAATFAVQEAIVPSIFVETGSEDEANTFLLSVSGAELLISRGDADPVPFSISGYDELTVEGGSFGDSLVIPDLSGTALAGHVVYFEGFEGDDLVDATAGGVALIAYGDEGSDTLIGGATDDSLNGGADNDQLAGGAGNDLLDGGAGADTMIGGVGDDVYIVDALADVVTENPSEGVADEVRTSVFGYVLPADVEKLTYTGSGASDLRGNAGDNVLVGASGNDFLRLQDGGADVANGGDGNDAVYFGAAFTAADKVDGGAGKDVVALQGDYSAGVTLGADSLVNVETLAILTHSDARFGGGSASPFSYNVTVVDATVAAGTQLLVNASTLEAGENLTFDGHLETDGSFFIYGGKGIDALTGGSGVDVFFFAEDGRFAPSDHIDGGAGNDILVLRGNYALTLTAGSIVNVETVTLMSGTDARFYGAGTDFNYVIATDDSTVAAGATMTFNGGGLRATETLHFDGSAETNGAFRVFGGAGADTITGGGGADLIFGGLGADLLKGGGGADVFRYQGTGESTASAMDKILDFTSGDHIDMSRAGHFAFIGSAAFGGHAGELRVENSSGNVWLVQGDADGDGRADFVLQVTVADGHALAGADFLL
ncbi:MAG: calcium-binding protein, partial [Allosphingosinicella sp.]